MKTAYNTTVWYNDPNLFDEVSGKQGFQLWTVPKTGTYRITAQGGQGGRPAASGTFPNNPPGNGADIRADIAFTMGTKIVIIVGQAGPQSIHQNTGSGGGGATWILKENFTSSNDQVYMVAGGGGGAGASGWNVTGYHANGSSQGVLGSGGAAGSGGFGAGGGAGWTGNGVTAGGANPSGQVTGGKNPTNGAMGGERGYDRYPNDPANDPVAEGGFGGGGGDGYNRAGGGAGATGGRSANAHNDPGMGGTSYITTTATNRTFTGQHSSYEGSVYIQAPGTF